MLLPLERKFVEVGDLISYFGGIVSVFQGQFASSRGIFILAAILIGFSFWFRSGGAASYSLASSVITADVYVNFKGVE